MNRARLNFICLSAFLTALEWNTEGRKEKEPVCDCSAEGSGSLGLVSTVVQPLRPSERRPLIALTDPRQAVD